MTKRKSPYKLGIALSGGTFKAACHVGVLNALESLGIVPDCVAGTSAGSLVAALYAHGYRGEEFRQLIRQFPAYRLLDYGFPLLSSVRCLIRNRRRGDTNQQVPNGLLRGRKYQTYIHRLLENREPTLPYFVVATNLVNGQSVTFHDPKCSGSVHNSEPITNVGKVIAGSCAVPGVFSPVVIEKSILVDGAFRDYVPVNVLRAFGCEKIIAVNLYRLPRRPKFRTSFDVLVRSYDILLRESIENDFKLDGDICVIEPDLTEFEWSSVRNMGRCMDIGAREVLLAADRITQYLTERPIHNLKRKTRAEISR